MRLPSCSNVAASPPRNGADSYISTSNVSARMSAAASPERPPPRIMIFFFVVVMVILVVAFLFGIRNMVRNTFFVILHGRGCK